MSNFLIFLVTLQLIWTLYFIKFAKNWFGPRFIYLDLKEVQENPKYEAFTRNDKKNWSKLEFYLTGIFLLPFRMITFFSFMIICFIACKLTVYFFGIKEFEKPQPKKFKKLIRLYIVVLVKSGLFILGFFYIKKKKIILSEKKHPKLKISKSKKSIVTVSNHVSFIDVFYYMMDKKHNFCYIAKEEFKKYPFIGFVSQVVQCVFIDRFCKKDANRVLDTLKKRVEDMKNGQDLSEFVVFAEGTTTNGKCLSSFKKGAFVLDTPLRIVGLKYNGNFCTQLNMCSTLECVIGTFCNFYNELTVFEVEDLIEKNGNMEWEEYAEAVRKVYCEEMGFKNSGGSYRLKNEFEKRYLKDMS